MGTTGATGSPPAPPGRPLHGEFVVPRGQGTATVLVQRGQITAVSSTSITVKSSDDYTATYAFDSSSRLFGAPTRPLRTPSTSPSPSAGPNASADPDAKGGQQGRHRPTITAADLAVGDHVALMAAKAGTTPTVERLVVLPARVSSRYQPSPAPSTPAPTPSTPAPSSPSPSSGATTSSPSSSTS